MIMLSCGRRCARSSQSKRISMCVVRQRMDVMPSRRLSNYAPDLIILNLSMPVMNGLDAARVLRRLLPSVPLIMYSAFGDQFAEQQAGLIGVPSLFSKSEPVATLIGKARGLLTATAA